MTQAALQYEPPRGARTSFPVHRDTIEVRFTPQHAAGEVVVRMCVQRCGPPGAPVVAVLGGISADRNVSDGQGGWWSDLVGPGRAIDTNAVQVISFDWLSSADVKAAAVTTADQADVFAAVLAELGVEELAAWVGSSYGGMVGLAFASRHPERLRKLVVLAAAHRPHPISTAQRSVQRGIIELGLDTGACDRAVSLARQLAMTTYRGADEFAERFSGPVASLRRPVEGYLAHAGESFVQRFDARRYLSLSLSIDLHEVDPQTIQSPTTLIAFPSDRLVPVDDIVALGAAIAAPTDFHLVPSLFGHDGFLKEYVALAPILSATLQGLGA